MHDLGAHLSALYALPFAGLLLCVAIMPLVAGHFWEHHLGKIAGFWAACVLIPLAVLEDPYIALFQFAHTAVLEYMPFVILILGLYTAAGGLVVEGAVAGNPSRNTGLLAAGSILASVVGTTGASMVLIRPLLRGISKRKHQTHTVMFFIFLVSNIGGSLTPIGDPPLFLGFLHGVEFFWPTQHLLPPMALCTLVLLALYYAVDSYFWQKETRIAPVPIPMGGVILRGPVNALFLMAIVGAVIVSGVVKDHSGITLLHAPGGHEAGGHDLVLTWVQLGRDGFILGVAWLSLRFTQPALREWNGFSWGPVSEVARLFAGIFVCLIPIILILNAGSAGHMGWLIEAVNSPARYFWVTGALSSFLDNAPTYLLFFNVAGGDPAVPSLMTDRAPILVAISCGAVFMGANSYIGNAPNFLVRNIAAENDVPMPTFFGYLAWSGGILIPLFVLVTLVFF